MHHSNDYNMDHSLQIPEILSRPLMKHGRKKAGKKYYFYTKIY